MNHWWQTRQFLCPRCKATYLHDQAYQHSLFTCPARQVATATCRNPHPRKEQL